MSYTVTATEYIAIDGVPLSTPAWITTDLSELNDGPENRGSNLIVPRRPGAVIRRRVRDSRIVNIPIVIFGDKDAENNAYADAREGLLDNIDALKKALRMPNTALSATRLLTYYRPTGTVEAIVQTTQKLDIEQIGPTTARGVLTIEIPAGVLRNTTDTVLTNSVGADTTINITVPGSGEVFAAVFNIPGAATSLTLTNNTSGHGLNYPHAITTGLVINSGAVTATDGATQVGGRIVTSGTPFWMPLQPGANQIRVQRPTGGTVSMTITFRAVWL